jgi:hypothetical protein
MVSVHVARWLLDMAGWLDGMVRFTNLARIPTPQ